MGAIALNNKRKISKPDSGFTLVELMIAMVVSGLIMVAVYAAYRAQQNVALAQEQVTEMQQNLRAGLNALARDARLAGYDPFGRGAGIDNDGTASFQFTMDNDDGGLTSRLFELYSPGDIDADDTTSLRRTATGSAVANNIEAIEFRYLDEDNDETTVNNNIRTVRISMLARADNPDRNFTNSRTYTFASGETWVAPGDNYRRRLQIVTVQLRNMGLNDD